MTVDSEIRIPDADVIVIGVGAAGVAAAITAAEAGASVLVLEKQSADRHTPSAVFAGSMIMLAVDEDQATQYLLHCANSATAEPECRAWAHGAAHLESWLTEHCPGIAAVDLGGHHAGAIYPDLPGSQGVVARDFRFPGERSGSGELLHRSLMSALRRTGRVEVRWDSPARRLIRDAAGAVIGVEFGRSDEPARRVLAGSGVVLACGGFENDIQACATFLRATPMYFAGNPANAGDGLRMAQQVGAGLWHMNVAIGRQATHVQGSDGRWHNYQMHLTDGAFVVVDRFGRRFCDESAYVRIHTTWHEMQMWDVESRSFSRIPAIWIFDSRRFAARLAAGSDPANSDRPAWSQNNRAELDRGWVRSAWSIEGLAAELDLDPAILVQTVQQYNDTGSGGADRFGRAAASRIALDQPPFYAVLLYPGGVNTSGGPRHDAGGRVLDAFGDPLAGLYAAGTVSQLIGHTYPSPGAGWSEALCSGQIAGQRAAEFALVKQ
jgi:succinate dehydrogenase/fumarate reductase flavoprotein subunit